MPIYTPNNSRERNSRITDTRILRPGDLLQLYGRKFMAFIAVLDSHDPSADPLASLRPAFGMHPALPNHHHVLVQQEDEEEVLSTGLYVGTGRAEDLLFGHVTPAQKADETYAPRLARLGGLMQAGIDGLFYVSDHEHLSATPQGQTYVDSNGDLLR